MFCKVILEWTLFLSGQAVGGPDEQGEICVKSPQCFIGYLNKDEKNKEVSDDIAISYQLSEGIK